MFSLATPTVENHFQAVIEQMQGMMGFVEDSLASEAATHEVERGLWSRLLGLGHALLEAFFVASGDGHEGERLVLEDGREIKRLATRPRPYRSLFGTFRLERAVYGQREGQVIEAVPLDARLKLPEDCTSYHGHCEVENRLCSVHGNRTVLRISKSTQLADSSYSFSTAKSR